MLVSHRSWGQWEPAQPLPPLRLWISGHAGVDGQPYGLDAMVTEGQDFPVTAPGGQQWVVVCGWGWAVFSLGTPGEEV
jgi:hypothetical protein